MLYSLKLSRILPAGCNRHDAVEGRHEYANWFLEEAKIHHPVFIANVVSISGRPGVKDGLALDSVLIVKYVDKRDTTLSFAWRCLKSLVWHHSDGWADQIIRELILH